MRDKETYEAFCRYCLKRVERPTIAEAVRMVGEHEVFNCAKNPNRKS